MRGSNEAYARRTLCNHFCSLYLCHVQAASQVFTLLTNCFPSLHCTYKLLTRVFILRTNSSQVFTLRMNCFSESSLRIQTASWVFPWHTHCFLSLYSKHKLLPESSLQDTDSNPGGCSFSRLGVCAGATKHMREGHFVTMSAVCTFATYKLPPRFHFTCKLLPKSSLCVQTPYPTPHFTYKLLPRSSLYV